jgi:Cys-tRNA(Pro)/Cys-tRNA(Cys) deacylase
MREPAVHSRVRCTAVTTGTPATAALARAGIPHTLHSYRHDPRAKSFGEAAAAALGVATDRIFKTLIVAVDGRLVCAVVPVAARLDAKAVAAAVGGKRAELADPPAATRATGYVLGGISPLGQKTTLPVLLDASVQAFETVFVSAGRRGLQVELAPADLLRLTDGSLAAIATT